MNLAALISYLQTERTKKSSKENTNREIRKEMSPIKIPISAVYTKSLSPPAEDITARSSPIISPNKINSQIRNKNLSVDITRIKEECLEENNFGSDLNESSDEIAVENIPIKTECNGESVDPDTNIEFPLKIEPEAFDTHDSCEENDGDAINNVSMDDVWNIIGVDKQAEIVADKDDERKASDEVNSDMSNFASSKPKKDINLFKNHIDINISLPKCDYLLNSHARRQFLAEAKNKKRIAKKPRRTRARNSTTKDNAGYVDGIKTVFDNIIRDARKVNPKQFALPIEYVTNINLNVIGTEKGSSGNT